MQYDFIMKTVIYQLLLLIALASNGLASLPYLSHSLENADGCDPLIYRVLDDPRRSDAFITPKYNPNLLCDDMLPFGWYRFLSYGLSREMSTTCPPPNSCGTSAQIWINLNYLRHQHVENILQLGNTSVEACVSWGFDQHDTSHLADCCLFTLPVKIRNCGEFNVYYLGPTQGCSMAYCSSASPYDKIVNGLSIPIGSTQIASVVPKIPTLHFAAEEGICDVRTNTKCAENIPIFGQDFSSKSRGSCIISLDNSPKEFKYDVVFINSYEAHCSTKPELQAEIKKNNGTTSMLILKVENEFGVLSNPVTLTLFNSDCMQCDFQVSSEIPAICGHKKDLCWHQDQCFLKHSPHPNDECQVCSQDGMWIKLNPKESYQHFKLFESEVFSFSPNISDFSVRLGPKGVKKLENGTITWRVQMKNKERERTNELITLGYLDECGSKSEIKLDIEVIRCHCGNGGICVRSRINDSITCNCTKNFKGELCQEEINPCNENKCQNGQCVDLPDGLSGLNYQCRCYEGYTGLMCDILINYCNSSPCYKGVECIPGVNNYYCGKCPDGMEGDGKSCRIRDPCKPNPCYHGVTCYPDSNAVNFTCGPCPYRMTGTGLHCQEFNPCSSNPCFKNVECFPLGDTFVCGKCPPGLTGNGQMCLEIFNENNLCAFEKSNPCFDKSLCKQEGSEVFCTACPVGYKGNGIECVKVDENPCHVHNPCHPQSVCLEVNGIATCGPCPGNMSGNGKICYSFDACLPNPCHPGATCTVNVTSSLGFTCGQCPGGLIGNGLTCNRTEDEEKPPDVCLPSPCHPKVECKIVNHKPKCGACPTNMTGNGFSCRDIRPCEMEPCYPGVKCHSLATTFHCGDCPEGMEGDGISCQEKRDPCSSNPCYPGTKCYSFHDRYKCGNCPSGYTGNGAKCSPFLDPCASNPCYDGVHCVTVWEGKHASFSCGLCPDGMVGDGVVCTATDPCSSNPCQQSEICQSLPGEDTYNCLKCEDSCKQADNPCDDNPCYPGTRCYEKAGGFTCGDCPIGYYGDGITCHATTIECPDLSRCFPGVTECIRQNNTIVCGSCPRGYEGDGVHCRPICQPKCSPGYWCSSPQSCSILCNPDCINGGKCLSTGICKCPPGFEGHFCQQKIDMLVPRTLSVKSNSIYSQDCVTLGCKNGGTCLTQFGECVCDSNYSGKFCEHPNDATVKCRRKCRNGGVCIGKNICKCTKGYRGRFCQKPKCIGGCKHGTCISPNKCQCMEGYGGPKCKTAICEPPCRHGGKCARPGICHCKKHFRGSRCEKYSYKNRRRKRRRRKKKLR